MPNRADGHAAGGVAAAPCSRLRYRLDVLGVDAADVVQAAGGWLFDRAMAGWEVGVWLTDTDDARALAVLGARVHPLAEMTSPPAASEAGAGLAVAGALVRADRAIGGHVADALRSGYTEVVLWGAPWPQLLGGRSVPARYHMSAAALAFKRQALIVLNRSELAVRPAEALICGGYRPPGSDLVSTGT
ncbi:hypothetical protein JRC04_06645 [Mycolicibacterium sp. S2-37]|nr:hypothetical protein [Mycolicibacterium sp. S2-37]